MLRTAKTIEGSKLLARDGELGRVKDFFFDEKEWTIRYFVVDTGGWLTGRRVLLAPVAVGAPDWEGQKLPTDLTKEQIRRSPGVETDQPVSVSLKQRQQLHEYFGWPVYWTGAPYPIGGFGVAPEGVKPAIPPRSTAEERESRSATAADLHDEPVGDPNLHSMDEVRNYAIAAADGAIGHVEDFLIDDTNWSIAHLVVDTRNWWPGRKVVVATEWIRSVNWAERDVVVDLTRDAIKGSPTYDPSQPLAADYINALHDFYQRPRYPRPQ